MDTSDTSVVGPISVSGNLLPPIEPGQSGNPLGVNTRTAGGAIKQRLNFCRKLTRKQLEVIVNNEHAVSADIIAAQRTIVAMDNEGYLSLHTSQFVVEQTAGKAIASVVVQHVDNTDPATQLIDLMDRVRSQGIAVPEHKQVSSVTRDVIERGPIGEQSLHSLDGDSAEE